MEFAPQSVMLYNFTNGIEEEEDQSLKLVLGSHGYEVLATSFS